MVFKAYKIDFIKTNSVLEALILENNLIKKHLPKYNTKEKDDKSYSYIVITKEEYPRVLIVRGKEIKAGLSYDIKSQFGPYPNASQLRESVSIIRKIFTFRDKCELNQKKPCFNYQIGLCPGTCFNLISKKDYLKIIKSIELFLSSKTSLLIKKLEREMKAYAKERKFEEAKKTRDTIFALRHIQDVAVIKADQSQSDVNFFGPRISSSELRPDTQKSTSDRLFRIEAYDAAHLAGSNNVGVMVVMEDGELKKSDYRKFKIQNSKGSDVGALQEMLERRLKHTDWTLPNLIVVDGNLIQLNVAKKLMSIPLVAVTKDERHKAKAIIGAENLVKKYKKEILLINNEAHRFAIAFHRKRRSAIL
jgi:excinuclease ABC subunit C